jgi:hypothetical protein
VLALVAAMAAGADAPPPAPALGLAGVRAQQVSASGTTLAFDVVLTNPSDAAIRVSGISFTVDVFGKRAIEGTLPAGAEVGARSSLEFPIVSDLRWADAPGMLVKAVTSKAAYRLTVAVLIRTPLGEIALPLTHDGELSVPKRPGFGLAGLRVASLNPLDAAVEVRVSMENENAFPLPAGLLKLQLSIAGADVTSTEVALPTVDPGAKVVVPIPVGVSLRRAGQGVFRALKGDTASVGLHATASIGGLAYPVDLEAQLPTHL